MSALLHVGLGKNLRAAQNFGRLVRQASEEKKFRETPGLSSLFISWWEQTETKKLSGLFDSDDEEEMEIDEEADEERFKIKPQFLGKAGEKVR